MSLSPDVAEKMRQAIEELQPSPARDELEAELGKEVEALNQRIEHKKIRMTPWDGLTVEQKLERMRERVKEVEHTIRWHGNSLQELREQISTLQEHTHADGRVMIPLVSKHRGQGYGAEASEKMVEGYF